MTPVMLSIAGADCSAGAGLQADLKTGFALGCYPLTALTCAVSEAPGRVEAIVPMSAEFVASQVRLCLDAFPVAAAKTGMLYSAPIVRGVAEALPPGLPLVVDPVMVATAGTRLMQADTLAAYEEALFPRATLITPNRDELLRLTGRAAIASPAELQAAACELAERVGCAVLAKGGHLPGDTCADAVGLPGERSRLWTHPRTRGIPTHGTGCTLSAAITAGLAHGHPLEDAIERALAYTAEAIRRSHAWGDTHALNHHPHGED